MNIISTACCRAVQLGFFAAMPLLPYREPAIYHSVNQLPQVLKEQKVDKILLVTDKGMVQTPAYNQLCSAMQKGGVQLAVYSDTRANPTVQNATDAAGVYRQQGCGAIVALGGGSAMDCAKAAGAILVRPGVNPVKLGGLLRVHHRLPLLIAVPTTAGTGSENTLTAVMTDPATHHKYTMNDFCLIPKIAVLDPNLTKTLPPGLTATTGMDALTHAKEAYIGRSTTKFTRDCAVQAVQLILQNLPTAYQNGGDMQARGAMLQASYLAGVAFSRSYVGYVHAIAHSLGGQYNTPHGYANAVLLPILLRRYGAAVHKKLCQLAVAAGLVPPGTGNAEGASALIQKIEQLNRDMGLPRQFDFINPGDIPAMARHAAAEANPLYPVPVEYTTAQLQECYALAMKGAV